MDAWLKYIDQLSKFGRERGVSTQDVSTLDVSIYKTRNSDFFKQRDKFYFTLEIMNN